MGYDPKARKLQGKKGMSDKAYLDYEGCIQAMAKRKSRGKDITDTAIFKTTPAYTAENFNVDIEVIYADINTTLTRWISSKEAVIRRFESAKKKGRTTGSVDGVRMPIDDAIAEIQEKIEAYKSAMY